MGTAKILSSLVPTLLMKRAPLALVIIPMKGKSLTSDLGTKQVSHFTID